MLAIRRFDITKVTRYTTDAHGRSQRRNYVTYREVLERPSISAFPPLCYDVLVESLLSAGLLLLDASVLVLQLDGIVLARHLLKERPLPLLAREPSAVELGWSLDDLADLRVLGSAGPQSLLLVLGVEQATHAQQLPVPLELWREVRLWKVEPVGAGSVLEKSRVSNCVQGYVEAKASAWFAVESE